MKLIPVLNKIPLQFIEVSIGMFHLIEISFLSFQNLNLSNLVEAKLEKNVNYLDFSAASSVTRRLEQQKQKVLK